MSDMSDMMGGMLLRGVSMPPVSHFTSAQRIKKRASGSSRTQQAQTPKQSASNKVSYKTVKTFQIVPSISVSNTSFSLNEKHLSKTGADY